MKMMFWFKIQGIDLRYDDRHFIMVFKKLLLECTITGVASSFISTALLQFGPHRGFNESIVNQIGWFTAAELLDSLRSIEFFLFVINVEETSKSYILHPFSTFSKHWFWEPFGSLLWLPFATLLASFGCLLAPFGTLLVPFGSLWATF